MNAQPAQGRAHTLTEFSRNSGKGIVMTATEFGLTLLYIAVAAIWYAAGWWQGKTVERDLREERAAGQDQLAQGDQQGQGSEVITPGGGFMAARWLPGASTRPTRPAARGTPDDSPSIGMRSMGQPAVSPSRIHETQPVNYA